jgi:hypothetical protein
MKGRLRAFTGPVFLLGPVLTAAMRVFGFQYDSDDGL